MFKGQLLITLSLAIFFTCPSQVKAESSPTAVVQETTQQSQSGTSSRPQTKRELINQLLEVTGSRKLWEQMLEVNFTQIEQNFSTLLPQIYNPSGELSQAEQENLDIIQEKATQIMTKFKTRLQENLSYDEMVEKVYYPLYDKYFTEQNLKDILAFYQTPTGQKTIEVMPQLAQESIQKMNELMLPKIIPILQEIIQEEMQSIESK